MKLSLLLKNVKNPDHPILFNQESFQLVNETLDEADSFIIYEFQLLQAFILSLGQKIFSLRRNRAA